MKKPIIVSFVCILIAALGVAGYYAWKNLRGAAPALRGPSGDIVKQINEQPATSVNATDMPLALRPGFSVSVFAENVPGARVLALDPAGVLLLSQTSAGKIVALLDSDRDGKSDSVQTIVSGLNQPHGLLVKCVNGNQECKLYVGETNQVSVFDYDTVGKKVSNKKKLADLPSGSGHFTRTLFDNGNKLLVSVGSSCNVCNESDDRRAKILEISWDGSGVTTFASGLRNSVFIARSLLDGKIWATENGRDSLGDNIPPEELNIIERGKDYGWPVCYGQNIHDTNFDKNTYIQNPCNGKTPPAVEMQAHSAPLGLAFIPEEGWPEDYWHNILVAFHGSWNRTEPTGYKIVRIKLNNKGQYQGTEDFITGWLPAGASKTQGALGRPVDILALPGGTLYISDDKAGVVYKISYRSSEQLVNSKAQDVRLNNFKDNQTVVSPLIIEGEAKGKWFFEASFPVRLVDANWKEIMVVPAQAKGDWMTESFVPFSARLEFKKPSTPTGWLVFQKDNPSGLSENAAEYYVPVSFQ